MKISFVLLLYYFHLDFFETVGSTPFTDHVCNPKTTQWLCVENKDQTVNLTIDCSSTDGHKHSAKIWIWSSEFPEEMQTMIIQNCNELILNISCNINKTSSNFQYLEIKNVSKLTFKESEDKMDMQATTRRPYSWRFYDEDLTPKKKKILDGILPTFTTFRDIQEATVKIPLISPDFQEYCKNKNYIFKSLELKNVKLNSLKGNFIGYSDDINNFLMDNVDIMNFEDGPVIVLNSTNATVKILNSHFPDLSQPFLKCIASEVTFSGNSFQSVMHELYGHYEGVFNISCNKFDFSGNTINHWGPKSFMIQSSTTNIVNNTIQQIGEKAFAFIYVFNRTDDVKNRYIFSNNVINFVHRDAFDSDSYINPLTDFDFFNISNNFFDCSCENFMWFDYIVRFEDQSSRKQILRWFNTKNNNRCSKLPNCTLNQVLHNVDELCEANYTCLETDAAYDTRSIKLIFKDMLKSLNDIAESNFNLLNLLMNGTAVRKIQKSNIKREKDGNFETFSQNEYYDKKIYSCLILLSCLSFIAFSFCAFIIYKKYPICKNLTVRRKSQSETALVFSHIVRE